MTRLRSRKEPLNDAQVLWALFLGLPLLLALNERDHSNFRKRAPPTFASTLIYTMAWLSFLVSLLLPIATVALVQWERGESRIAPATDLTVVDNGVVRVGVDKDRGGSITYFSGEGLEEYNTVAAPLLSAPLHRHQTLPQTHHSVYLKIHVEGSRPRLYVHTYTHTL